MGAALQCSHCTWGSACSGLFVLLPRNPAEAAAPGGTEVFTVRALSPPRGRSQGCGVGQILENRRGGALESPEGLET